MRRIVRILVLVVLLLLLVAVVWMRLTPEGRYVADLLLHGGQPSQHAEGAGGEDSSTAEERDAAAKLKTSGVMLVPAGPGQYFASINVKDLTLGDEGYRLVAKCRRLKTVTFIHCDLNDQRLQYLTGLSDLTSVNIIDTPAVTDAGMKHVAGLRQLVGLSLVQTGVGDAGIRPIGQLSELRMLDLSGTPITDAGLPALGGLNKLQWLLLSRTAVTDDGVAKLTGLSSLRQITLKGSKVTAKGKAQLQKMYPELKQIDL